MQVLFCLLGQSVVYKEACELFNELLGIEVSAPQLQRVCTHYGNAVDPLIKANCEAVIPRLETEKKDDGICDDRWFHVIYREDQWRELKLGRIFHNSKVVNIHDKRREVMDSIYVSHLGSVNEFFPKFERHLVAYNKKVILGDGAKWIWNWAWHAKHFCYTFKTCLQSEK